MQKRSIGLSIVLSIITCGIYGIYWFIVLTNETNAATGEQQSTSGGVAFLLTRVTCGIYGIYWAYKMGEKVQKAKTNRNLPADSNLPILYLVLCIIGLEIIVCALIQNELNQLA